MTHLFIGMSHLYTYCPHTGVDRIGIQILFIQFGYLNETREDINLTIRMIKELLPDNIGVSVSYPLPGTKFYDKVKEELKDKTNWTDSDDLAMMFQGTYNSKFYKKLHRYVHKEFRKSQSIAQLKYLLVHPGDFSYGKIRTVLSYFYYFPSSIVDRFLLKKMSHTNA